MATTLNTPIHLIRMRREATQKGSRAAAADKAVGGPIVLTATPHKISVQLVMDDTTRPATPQEREEAVGHLTLSAAEISVVQVDTQSVMQRHQLEPPSPAGTLCGPEEAKLSLTHSPAWETSANQEDTAQPQQRRVAIPVAPVTAPAAASATIVTVGTTTTTPSNSAPPQQAARMASPPTAGDASAVADIAKSQSTEWVLSAPPPSLSAPPPSVWGSDQDSTQIRQPVSRRVFFPSSLESSAAASILAAGPSGEHWESQAAPWPVGGGEQPESARSAGSGIFDLEIASPGMQPVTGTAGRRDLPHLVLPGTGGTVEGREADGREGKESRGCNIEPLVPSSSQSSLPGPSGKLQEVIDESKVFSPEDRASGNIEILSSVPNIYDLPIRFPVSTLASARSPSEEGRKGFARPITRGGYDPGAGSGVASSPLLRHPRCPPPAFPVPAAVPMIASAPTPAEGMPAGGTPCDTPVAKKPDESSPLFSEQQGLELEATSPVGAIKERSMSSPTRSGALLMQTKSARGVDDTAAGPVDLPTDSPRSNVEVKMELSDATVSRWTAPVGLPESVEPGGVEVSAEPKAPVAAESLSAGTLTGPAFEPIGAAQDEDGTSTSRAPLPMGALLAPETREATRAWVAAVAPGRDAESGRDTSSSESRSGFDTGWGKGWGLRGDLLEGDNTEDLLGTSWDSSRGFGGERFLRAEVIGDSPLRRAAGVAATAVTAAAGTVRVSFTQTSRTIGKVLAASAKSFEEFVEDQLREDGSGLVLRREGATGLLVPRGKTLTQAFVVAAGCYLCWEFRIKDHDLGFALRLRTQGIGGSREEDIFEMTRYRAGETFQGRWTAEGSSTAVVIMVWDNSYSCLRPKSLAYKVQVLQPGIDVSAPPPPPPPTPARSSSGIPQSRMFAASGVEGGGRWAGEEGGGHQLSGGSHTADTEAFAIDESEGEEPNFVDEGTAGSVGGKEGGGK